MSIKEQKPEFYNLGALEGSNHMKNKIMKIIEEIKMPAEPGMVSDYLYVSDLIHYLENGVDPE